MKNLAIRFGTVLVTASLCLFGTAAGQTDGSLFLQGHIEKNAIGLTLTTESDRRVFRIENPEVLRSPEGHRVVLHGTLTKDGIRVISAASIEQGRNPFNTALCEMAAYRKDVAMVSHLLELGADPNAKTPKGSPALIEAIEGGLMRWGRPPSLQITTLLLGHGADPNAMDRNWQTPLMAAAFTGNDGVVKILLDHKANVNIGDKFGITALMNAQGARTTRLLLAAGAHVNDKDLRGRTALHWAALRGDPEVVKALIEVGVRVNAKDDRGLTALEFVKQQLRYAESDADKSRGNTNRRRFQNVAEILLVSGAS
jgi:uncharacterized protein